MKQMKAGAYEPRPLSIEQVELVRAFTLRHVCVNTRGTDDKRLICAECSCLDLLATLDAERAKNRELIADCQEKQRQAYEQGQEDTLRRSVQGIAGGQGLSGGGMEHAVIQHVDSWHRETLAEIQCCETCMGMDYGAARAERFREQYGEDWKSKTASGGSR
jgi:hypothetical protein